MPVVCVEPAVNAAHSVVTTNGNDSLVFPHVDSCMSVTFMVAPDVLIGGHAGMFDHNPPYGPQAGANLLAIVTTMMGLVAGRAIQRVVFCGNNMGGGPGTNWALPARIAALRLATGNPALPCKLVNSANTGGGVDVVFNNGTMRMRVQAYQFEAGRGDLGVPAQRAAIYDVPYHAIVDTAL